MATETVSLVPTWRAAVSICIMCLENENASDEGRRAAREELYRLADYVDNMNRENDND